MHDPVLQGLSSTPLIRGTMTTYRKQNNRPANVSRSIRDAGHFVIPAFVFPWTPFSNREFNLRRINGCSLCTGAQCPEIRCRNLFCNLAEWLFCDVENNDREREKIAILRLPSRIRSFVFRCRSRGGNIFIRTGKIIKVGTSEKVEVSGDIWWHEVKFDLDKVGNSKEKEIWLPRETFFDLRFGKRTLRDQLSKNAASYSAYKLFFHPSWILLHARVVSNTCK